MRLNRFFLSLLAAIIFLTGMILSAQEIYHSPEGDLFARLSYDSSVIQHADGVRHICLAVSPDGNYRVERSLITGTERLEGKLTKEQFEQLHKLLAADQFRVLSGDLLGLIRQDSESFAVDIPKGWRSDDGSQRLQWLNADGERPFPEAMAKVVEWLKHFQPQDAKAFVYAEYPDVCPLSGLRRVQPTVADNQHP
jgi:hypothetical protein